MNSAFNSQILAEKLRKLNNSQQSIETLSHWCIFHRKKAHLVVETWDKQVRELQKEQKIPLLYLANDILQNSRRRGGEFVTEFWKILPGTLKDVMEKADNRVHAVVFRLVDIWDERKVFGSRSRTLREELLGDDPPTDLPEHHVKPSHTIRIKVPVGGIQEKLTSAYQSVSDVASDEDATLGRCNAAVIRIESLEKEANILKNSGESQDFTTMAEELHEQQKILIRGVEQLEMSEQARAALVAHLKEALREQESKLELIRTQLQAARSQAERTRNLQQQLFLNNSTSISEVDHGIKEPVSESLASSAAIQRTQLSGSLSWPAVPFVENVPSMADESKSTKSAASVAAEMAAKLAASASSAQMLTSVLSSFVAEEASHSRSENVPAESPSSFVPEKRQRVNGPNEQGQTAEGVLPLRQSIGIPHLTDPLLHTQQTSANMQVQLPHMPLPIPHLPQPPPQPQPQHQHQHQHQHQPQPHYTGQTPSMHPPGFGYAAAGPQPPMPPPMQRQLVVGMPPVPMQPQNSNPGHYQPMQPPAGYYGQLPLQTQLPRQ